MVAIFARLFQDVHAIEHIQQSWILTSGFFETAKRFGLAGGDTFYDDRQMPDVEVDEVVTEQVEQ